MKLIIDIPEEVKQTFDNAKNEDLYGNYYDHNSLIGKAIQNGTPIPDNATNGQVIQTLFKPNRVERTDDNVIVENYDFSKEWWNAQYQKGGKE